MKFRFLMILFSFFFILSFRVESQTSVPKTGSTSQPASTSSSKPIIPVVPVGDQIKPTKSSEEKSAQISSTPRTVRINKIPVESKETIYSRKTKVGDEIIFVVAKGVPLIAQGTPILGKITVLEKPRGGNPGRLSIVFEKSLSGHLELVSAPDKQGSHGREIFMPVGTKQTIVSPSKIKPSLLSSQKVISTRGSLTAKAETEDLLIKINEGKSPGTINIYVELPPRSKTSLKGTPLKMTRVNNFNLLQPVISESGIRGDHNKNGIEDLHFVFNGWDLAKYLPEGISNVVFLTSTKSGKPVEAIARVKMEFR